MSTARPCGLPRLERVSDGARCFLQSAHLVGRSTLCDLRIDESYVSTEHAVIRWLGTEWELRDLSRNGTEVGGVRLTVGESRALRLDTPMSFGHSQETWVLVDASPPRTMVVSNDGACALLPEGDVIAVPSNEAPEATVIRDSDGEWVLENSAGELVALHDRDMFSSAERVWRFCQPQQLEPTAVLQPRPSLKLARLVFNVSRDEEHVQLNVQCAGRSFDLGARNHNYLLLTLARYRLSDAAAGQNLATCGWVHLEQLLRALGTNPTQLNVDIHRVRKQFSELGVFDAATIVERRPHAGQLRLGVADVVVAPA
jgi:pSer/pThr/pTyr-binding forkhead associated (FHA) protein